MAYTQKPGRGPMQKTGRGIPEGFKQIQTPDPKKKEERSFIDKAGDAASAFVSNFNANETKKTGNQMGQGSAGSGSRKGNKDILDMASNAYNAARKAYNKS